MIDFSSFTLLSIRITKKYQSSWSRNKVTNFFWASVFREIKTGVFNLWLQIIVSKTRRYKINKKRFLVECLKDIFLPLRLTGYIWIHECSLTAEPMILDDSVDIDCQRNEHVIRSQAVRWSCVIGKIWLILTFLDVINVSLLFPLQN